MAVEITFRVPDWLMDQALNVVNSLPIVIGSATAEKVADEPEDTDTDPDAACCCYDSYRPDPDCVAHGIRVVPDLMREAV